MNEYHKIQTVWKRDPDTKFKTLLHGAWALPEFDYLQNNSWVFTEKVDGTNIRVMWDGEVVRFGGKTDRAQIPTNLLTHLQDTFTPDRMTGLEPPICLYGEGYGAGIQKVGKLYSSDQKFVLFDVKVGEWWLLRQDVEDVAKRLEIDAVPMITKGTLHGLVGLVSARFPSVWGDFPAEGVVAHPELPLCTRDGKRIITKLKCKDFPQESA